MHLGMGPLSNLRIVGFLCPCHESDEEYHARVAFLALWRGIRIQWYRNASTTSWERSATVLLDASLRIVDSRQQQQEGPFLEVRSNDAHLSVNSFVEDSHIVQQTPRETVCRISFTEIGFVELVETAYHSEIHVVSLSNTVLLRFSVTPKSVPWYTRYCCCCCCCCRPFLTPQVVVMHVRAILKWNTQRQEELEERFERRQTAQRLRDERLRLMTDSSNKEQQTSARMAIV